MPDKFAFILHPLSPEDLARKVRVLRYLPPAVSRLALRLYGARKVSDIVGIRSRTGKEVEGMFIACPLTSEMLLYGDVERNTATIVECCKIAEDEGAKIVGLGALTAVVGDAGITIAERSNIAVTTGNTYTVATAIEGALRALNLLGKRPEECTTVVVGAAGSIGAACAKLLKPDVGSLTLVDLKEDRLRELAEELGEGVGYATSPNEALPAADLVVTVTSAVTAVIEPEPLKPGAVVCDVARPRDVSKEVARQRPDVLVIEGGVVAVPGDVDFGLDFGFPPRTAYACMSETMILALEERWEDYTLGRTLSLEKVREIRDLATKHGFELAGFRSFERPVSNETIERVRAYATR